MARAGFGMAYIYGLINHSSQWGIDGWMAGWMDNFGSSWGNHVSPLKRHFCYGKFTDSEFGHDGVVVTTTIPQH